MDCYLGATSRREFLRLTAAGAAALAANALPGAGGAAEAAAAASPMPTVKLGKYTITRLLSGGNPIGGYSHSTPDMSAAMLEWFTPERTVQYIHRLEQEGITTWQFDYFDYIAKALRTAREGGSKMQFICVHHDGRKGSLAEVVKDVSPLALMHHGGVTDTFFREGKSDQVHDFVKRAHDAGVMAGVSTHNPDNVRRMADENWEVDLFMTCFHHLSRTVEEQRKRFNGAAAIHEPFFDTDPIEMAKVVREVPKPCLAFKILAAGRRCWSAADIEGAFQFAYSNIKKTDAVIVGMFPRYKDQVKENAGYARKHGVLPT